MRLKYRVTLAVISILMVMTLFVSSSYSLWKVTVAQQEENVISSGCFNIELKAIDGSKNINLGNTYPMTDEKGKNLSPYTFVITNNCTIDASYTIYLNQLIGDSKTDETPSEEKENIEDYIKYTFKKEGSDTTEEEAKSLKDLETIPSEELEPTDITFNYSGKNVKTTYKLDSGTLTGKKENASNGEEDKYILHLWISDEATNSIAGQTFEAGISVVAYATNLDKTA